jgi:hypothetical protein
MVHTRVAFGGVQIRTTLHQGRFLLFREMHGSGWITFRYQVLTEPRETPDT